MFVLVGVSFVTAVVMMAAPIPLLTGEMKSNVDMTVARNLIVAQFVVCRNNIVVIVIWPDQSKVRSHLAASVWLRGPWQPPPGHRDFPPSPRVCNIVLSQHTK